MHVGLFPNYYSYSLRQNGSNTKRTETVIDGMLGAVRKSTNF